MKEYFKFGFVVTICLLVLFCQSPTHVTELPTPVQDAGQDLYPDEPLAPEYDVSGLVLHVQVMVYASEIELNKAFVIAYSGPDNELTPVWGFYTLRKGVCTIHVLPLTDVNKDPDMVTWGHELAHCVYGRYHAK